MKANLKEKAPALLFGASQGKKQTRITDTGITKQGTREGWEAAVTFQRPLFLKELVIQHDEGIGNAALRLLVADRQENEHSITLLRGDGMALLKKALTLRTKIEKHKR